MGKTSKESTIILKRIGNALMLLSVLGFFLLFFPIFKEEFLFRTGKFDIKNPVSQEFSIIIPSLGINAPVLENINPWNKSEYLKALEKGIAHASGSSVPNQSGTVFLFAHSSDVPWRITRYNTAFFRLNRLKKGNEITVTYQGENFYYKVKEKKMVWPNEISYTENKDTDQLILQTCYPIGTSIKRLLVLADPS